MPDLTELALVPSAEKPREACFDPGNIMNGTRVGTDFKLGSTVTYQCDPGYTILDPSSITCVIGADGKPAWDRVLPSCSGTCTGPACGALDSESELVCRRLPTAPCRLRLGSLTELGGWYLCDVPPSFT